MLYEQPKRKKKHRFAGKLIKLILSLLLIMMLLAAAVFGVLYVAPMSLFLYDSGEDIHANADLPVTAMSILLFGVDTVNDHGQRTDTMMLLSMNDDKGMVLTSVMRDIAVPLEGHGTVKLNALYSYGGTNLMLSTINDMLHMNAQHYVRADYMALVHAVDAIGGIDISITEAEAGQINSLILKREAQLNEYGYLAETIDTWGENTHLNGIQTLSYVRIRKIDSDFSRTGRQRQVVMAMWEKLRTKVFDLNMWQNLYAVLRDDVETDLTAWELMMLAVKAVKQPSITTHRLPAEGYYTDDGSKLTIDADANASLLYDWIYGGAEEHETTK